MTFRARILRRMPSARALFSATVPATVLLAVVLLALALALGGCAGTGAKSRSGEKKRYRCPPRDKRTACWYDKETNKYYRYNDPTHKRYP